MNKFKIGDYVTRKAEYLERGSWDSRCRALRIPNDGDFVIVDYKLSGDIQLRDHLSGRIVGWWVADRFECAYEKVIVECGDED